MKLDDKVRETNSFESKYAEKLVPSVQRRIVIATHVAELGFSLNFRGGRGCCRSTGDWLKGPATPRGRINIAAEGFTATTR